MVTAFDRFDCLDYIFNHTKRPVLLQFLVSVVNSIWQTRMYYTIVVCPSFSKTLQPLISQWHQFCCFIWGCKTIFYFYCDMPVHGYSVLVAHHIRQIAFLAGGLSTRIIKWNFQINSCMVYGFVPYVIFVIVISPFTRFKYAENEEPYHLFSCYY